MRVSRSEDSKYFYALDEYDSGSVRALGVLGLISLAFLILGFVNFLRLSPVISIIFAPVVIVISLYHVSNYSLLALYPGFDIRKHQAKVSNFKRRGKFYPNVAVLVPAAGEDSLIVETTIKAAMAIDYPAYKVFILDDSKKAIYKGLASSLGCRYLRRPDVGHLKKAGNMNHALRYLDGFDHILILDADFKARPEILNELVAYSGDDVGIVQSPQHFPMTSDVHKRSKIEYGAAYIQQDFYRVTQVARDRFGAAICVGTNALYNIKAIKKVGGYEGVGELKGWGHSEDVNTGLKIINARNELGKRYRIKYIPVQLAEGFCPDEHYIFYKQQNRWCTGSMQLLFSGRTLFSRSLSMPQRLIYGSSALYYYYTILTLSSPLYLLVITLLNNRSEWIYTLLFLPALITNVVIGPFMLRKPFKPISTSLVVLSNAYTFLQASILLIMQRPLGWEASGVKQTGRTNDFMQFKMTAVICFMLLYALTFGAILLNDKFEFGPSIIIETIFMIGFVANIAFMYYTLLGRKDDSKPRYKDRDFYAALVMTVMVITIGVLGFAYHSEYRVAFGKYDLVTLVNQTGATRVLKK